jgi:hypothetical protein
MKVLLLKDHEGTIYHAVRIDGATRPERRRLKNLAAKLEMEFDELDVENIGAAIEGLEFLLSDE